MGARQKLNQFHAISSLIVAVVFGSLTGSSVVFVVVAAAWVSVSIYAGNIRAGMRRK